MLFIASLSADRGITAERPIMEREAEVSVLYRKYFVVRMSPIK